MSLVKVGNDYLRVPDEIDEYVKANRVPVSKEQRAREDGTGFILKNIETEDGIWLLMKMTVSDRLVIYFSEDGDFSSLEAITRH